MSELDILNKEWSWVNAEVNRINRDKIIQLDIVTAAAMAGQGHLDFYNQLRDSFMSDEDRAWLDAMNKQRIKEKAAKGGGIQPRRRKAAAIETPAIETTTTE